MNKIIVGGVILLSVVAGLFLPLAFKEKQELNISYTPSTDRICNGEKCNLVLYSGIRNVYEDEGWKRVEHARSLKNSGVELIFKQWDDEWPIEIIDYNLTHAIVKLKGREAMIRLDVNKTFKYGLHSTTIKLQDNETENLDDTYARWEFPDTNYGDNVELKVGSNSSGEGYLTIIKFNISSIPSGQTINEALFALYIQFNGLDASGEGYNISSHHHYNQTWDEMVVTWNNFESLGSFNATRSDTNYYFGGTGEPVNIWHYWNVTNTIQIEYSLENENATIYLKTHDIFGSPTLTDRIDFHSKGAVDSTIRPYLNITYSEEVPEDTCTCAGLNQDWEIDHSDYCNITDACDLGTGTLSFTGAGWCNCNASVDTTNLGDPGASGVLYIQDSCLITID